MVHDDYFELGYIIKAHGIAGALYLFIDSDDPLYYASVEALFIEQDAQLIPYLVEEININQNKAIIKLEDVDHRDVAEGLIGSRVFLPLDLLPELKQGAYYFHDLIGLDFYDDGNLIGKVEGIVSPSIQNLIVITHGKAEIMIPLNEEIIKHIDFEGMKIQASLPEGLLEIYKEDK
ncbi:MAG TPA: ribosome maturation factor RimM [Cyclobacteriaceae bacterium]